MKVGEFVLVHLVNPKEKFWGILRERDSSGVTVRGLSLEGFEGWLHEISRRETVTVLPSTVFFPLHRVERIFMDETAGDFVSFADRFKRTVGAQCARGQKKCRGYCCPTLRVRPWWTERQSCAGPARRPGAGRGRSP